MPDSRSNPRLHVIQWATGNIGRRALRAVVEHPDLTLAGVYVHDADKAGRDAGDLCGCAPTGVIATDDVDDFVDLDADCVLYMQQGCDFEVLCRLLAVGLDVVTTVGAFHRPASLDPARREQVEAACREGGTSIHSTGSSPGFITEAVPLVLTSLQRRLDHLAIDEYANLSERDSPTLLFELMGFGGPADELDERRLSHLRSSFGPSLQLLADSLSMPLDAVDVRGEVAATPRRIDIAAGTLPAGSLAGQRITVSGRRVGRELLRFRANCYCTPELDPAWDLQDTGWRVSVEGDTPLEVSIQLPVPLDQMAAVSPGYTAHRAVNAIAVVCAAEPGIRTTADLPQVIASLG
jgi:4-hydroxy-tetrahydrodipicolinate reductase